MRNRFVICIGSQRAGTTLFHRLLGETTSIFMHPVKELHYFDTINEIRPQQALTSFSRKQLKNQIDTITGANSFDFIDDAYKCMLRANKMLAFRPASEIQYHDLFRPMLSSKELLGEATPEYMMLTADQISKMSQVISTNAVIILLCRDPVKRILSSAKLFNVYNDLTMDSETLSSWLMSCIQDNNSWITAQDKYNNYEAAINNYTNIFPNFLALSFEEMLIDPAGTAAKLQDELGIQVNQEAFVESSKKVTNSLSEQTIDSPDLINVLSDRYSESKRFLCEYFGSTYAG
jgi:hypothetical protein